jgi:hypothetical protein
MADLVAVPCQECKRELAGDSPELRLELTDDNEPLVALARRSARLGLAAIDEDGQAPTGRLLSGWDVRHARDESLLAVDVDQVACGRNVAHQPHERPLILAILVIDENLHPGHDPPDLKTPRQLARVGPATCRWF